MTPLQKASSLPSCASPWTPIFGKLDLNKIQMQRLAEAVGDVWSVFSFSYDISQQRLGFITETLQKFLNLSVTHPTDAATIKTLMLQTEEHCAQLLAKHFPLSSNTIEINPLFESSIPSLPCIPRSIADYTNLTKLIIRDANLLSIPTYICQVLNLEQLDFSCNAITTLPFVLMHSPNLKKIHIEKNPLEKGTQETIELLQNKNIQVFYIT